MSLQNRTPTYQEVVTQFAHTAGTTALTPLLINSKVFIPLNSANANALNAFLVAGQISDYAQAAVAFAAGDKIYWDDTAKKFTNVSTSNTLCGYALEPSASGTGAGIVLFNSNAA